MYVELGRDERYAELSHQESFVELGHNEIYVEVGHDEMCKVLALSFLVFDRIFSCHMIIISVLYIFQLSLHKTAVNFSTNGFTSGLY